MMLSVPSLISHVIVCLPQSIKPPPTQSDARAHYFPPPHHLQNEMLKVNGVLDLPAHGGHLALHWYEWDTLGYALGSNHTKCDRVGAPCTYIIPQDFFSKRHLCAVPLSRSSMCLVGHDISL
jgi:hypothetical protein